MFHLDTAPRGHQVQRLRAFLVDCADSAAEEQGQRLRDALDVLGASRALQAVILPMLACGAYESAALALLRERSFLVSRGASGLCLASALADDGSTERTAEAATPALALLSAYIAALLADIGLVIPAASEAKTRARLH